MRDEGDRRAYRMKLHTSRDQVRLDLDLAYPLRLVHTFRDRLHRQHRLVDLFPSLGLLGRALSSHIFEEIGQHHRVSGDALYRLEGEVLQPEPGPGSGRMGLVGVGRLVVR